MTISEAIKNLIVAMQGSGASSDIDEQTIAQVIQYMADNWSTISAGIGGGGEPYVLPEATTSTLGGVKEAATVAVASAADAPTISAAYTQAEVQGIATLANANKVAINAILTNLKAAGVMA